MVSLSAVTLERADAVEWLNRQPAGGARLLLTDPPFAVREFTTSADVGAWRQPMFGDRRLPRFTDLSPAERRAALDFHVAWLSAGLVAVAPGGHAIIAWHDTLLPLGLRAAEDAGWEWRGTLVRIVRGLRGGDRPKGVEDKYPDVRTSLRGEHEPWLVLRRPLPRGYTVARCLAEYGTGGLRGLPGGLPASSTLGAPIAAYPARAEKALACGPNGEKHPTLKSQALLRYLACLGTPLEVGPVLEPFAGTGSTLAACVALGLKCRGCERDPVWADDAGAWRERVSRLAALASTPPPRGERRVRPVRAP